jgi:uncharacterized protein (DUF2236 family)
MKQDANRVADLLNPAAVLLPAANVIMQPSLPGVGYGVLESPVDSGLKVKGLQASVQTGAYHRDVFGRRDHRHRFGPRTDPRCRRHRAPAGTVDAVEPGVLQRIRSCAAAGGGRLPVPIFRRPARILYGPLDDAIADTVYQDAKRLGYRLYLWDIRFRARRGWRIV